jgi:hypothetical protein
MKRSRFSEEQIIGILRESGRPGRNQCLLNMSIQESCRATMEREGRFVTNLKTPPMRASTPLPRAYLLGATFQHHEQAQKHHYGASKSLRVDTHKPLRGGSVDSNLHGTIRRPRRTKISAIANRFRSVAIPRSAQRAFGDRPLLPQNRCPPPQKSPKGVRASVESPNIAKKAVDGLSRFLQSSSKLVESPFPQRNQNLEGDVLNRTRKPNSCA